MATPNPYTTALLDPFAATRRAMQAQAYAMPEYESLLGPANPYLQAQMQPVQGELLGPEQPLPFVTPIDEVLNEQQSGIARRLAGNMASGLGYIGDSLDKLGSRQLRGLLGGKPRELLSFIPFSDALGITNPEDIVSSGDILGTRKKRGLGYRLLEFGTEALLDPMTLLGVGFGAKALKAGGKAAQAAGLLDDLGDVARANKMGQSVAKGTLTPRHLIDFADNVPSGLTNAQRMERFRTAVAAAEKVDPASLPQAVLDKYLDETLGGLVRIKPPLTGKEMVFGTQAQMAQLGGVPGMKTLGTIAGSLADNQVTSFLKSSPLTKALASSNPPSNWATNVARVASSMADDVFRHATEVVTAPLKSTQEFSVNPAQSFDNARDRFAKSGAGVQLKQWFNAPSMDAATRYGQQVAERVYPRLVSEKKMINETMHRMATDLMDKIDSGAISAEGASKQIRIAAELRNGFKNTNIAQQYPEVYEYVMTMADQLDGLLAESRRIGVPLNELKDLIAYFPRHVSYVLDKKGVDRIHNAFDPSQLSRQEYLRGWFGPNYEGTETVRDIISSDEVRLILEQGGPNTRRQLVALLKEPQYQDYYGVGASPVNANNIPYKKVDNDKIAEGLADFIMKLGDEGREMGGFGNHPFVDWGRRMLSGREAMIRTQAVLDWVADAANHGAGAKGSVSLFDFLKEAGTSSGGGKMKLRLGSRLSRGARYYLIEKLTGQTINQPLSKQAYKQANLMLKQITIPLEAKDDFFRFLDLPSLPKSTHWAMDMADSFISLFKAGVLTRPSRYTRDFTGAVHTNWTIGAFDAQDYIKTYKLITGEHGDIDLTDIPEIRANLTAQGKPVNKQNALKEFSTLLAANNVADSNTMSPNIVSSSDPVGKGMKSLEDILAMAPGYRPQVNPIKNMKTILPQTIEEADPRNIRGSMFWGSDGQKRLETKFAPAKWGEETGQFTESMNRIAPMIKLMRSGNSASEAAKKVLAAHADYSPTAFTTFERHIMARVFPFYRFTRKMIPFHLQALMEEPGGRMRNTMRLISSMRDRNSPLPEHIAQTAAIEVPGAPEGQQRFLTGFGLPMEDVFGLMRPNVNTYKTLQGTGQEIVGRMNPLLKTIVEGVSGKQMHSGRDLEDLRGTLSDIVYNLGLTDSPPNTPIPLEQLVSNSPASGVLNTLKQAIDPRKGVGTKALNLLTGLRFSDADLVKARNLAIREALEDLLRQNPNVHRFSHLYAPDMSALSPADQALMDMYRTMGAASAKDSRERKKAAAAAK
jgi:hypothetical protein